MLELYKHNKDAYNSVLKSWKSSNRTCVVHATGTGKSLIIAKNIIENSEKKHLFLSPSSFIFDELKKHLKNNIRQVTFITYQFLLNKNISLLKGYDYIYLDEFHRAGAEKWGKSINALLEQNPNSKILGTSATHIRYLDNDKNMAEILFNGNISSKLTLKDSIERKIHKKPIYVTALYKIENFIEVSKIKIENLNISEDKKKVELDKLYNLKINWEKSKGIDFILNKHLSKERKKIIIFCNNTKHLKESKNLLDNFFISYFGENLNILEVNSKLSNKTNENTLKKFNNNNCSILYCVDMLNEGVHVDNVDTCILLRETKSSIVYFQQIGRVFKVNQKRNPLIFDMVNNFKNANTKSDFIDFLRNRTKHNNYNDDEFNESKKNELLVEFHDEIKDFVNLFQNLDNIEWEDKLKLIKEYFCKYNHLPKSNTSLGVYVLNLKHKYRNNLLSKKDIEDLLKITPLFFNYINDIAWNKNYKLLKDYYLINQFLPKTNENIGKWLHKQKQKYKKNLLNDEYIEKLIEIDDTIFSQFREDLIDSRYNKNIEELKTYFKINKKFPPQSSKLGNWLSNIKYRDSASIELKEEIKKLDPNFFKNKLDNLWEENYNMLKDYYLKNEKIPPQNSKIGVWIAGIKQKKNKLKLSEEKIELLLEITPDFFKSKKEIDFENWLLFYNQLKEYYLKYKKLPKIHSNGSLGHWINSQKTYFNNNKLEKEKIDLLLNISSDFFKSKKEIDFENWLLLYNQVKEYYSNNNKLPNQSIKIGGWLSRQKSLLNKNKLDNEKTNMLKLIIT